MASERTQALQAAQQDSAWFWHATAHLQAELGKKEDASLPAKTDTGVIAPVAAPAE